MKILIINGPNLNLLGTREPDIYGSDTLDKINSELEEYKKNLGEVELEFFQSNHEGEIVDKIQATKGNADGIIINPAAYTHTSVAILDALRAVEIPTVEVHLSNVQSREEFRKNSYVSLVAKGTVAGFGKESYKMALFGLYNYLKNHD